MFDCQAENEKEKNMWIDTLRYVSSIASRRGMLMRKKLGQVEEASSPTKSNKQFFVEEEDLPPPPHTLRDLGSKQPSMRLEVDIKTIPPGSAERAKFVSSFQEDIGRCLFGGSMQGENVVKVMEVKPAPGMDWLTVVVFDLVVDLGGDAAAKKSYLAKLDSMVSNTDSDLYMGMVTCQADSTFGGILGSVDDTAR